MKNKLKIMIMIVLSMAILTGCSAKNPSDVVEGYFTEIKKSGNSELTNNILSSIGEVANTDSDKESKAEPKMEEAMKIFVSSLDAKVLSEDIKENKATVEVELTGINFANIIMELFQETFANAFSGNEMTDEDMNNFILEKIKSAKIETRTGKINLSKDDKEWKIDTEDDNFMSLVFGQTQQ